MQCRRLGDSDLNVSEISLGSWLTYGVGVERERSIECVNAAFDLGINFFDTANVYGRGAAETVPAKRSPAVRASPSSSARKCTRR